VTPDLIVDNMPNIEAGLILGNLKAKRQSSGRQLGLAKRIRSWQLVGQLDKGRKYEDDETGSDSSRRDSRNSSNTCAVVR
jgi:hypothetical protein